MPLNFRTGHRVHFTSLGCPRNLVDTEVMLGLLLQAGYEVTDAMNEADFLIVNTCGFLESSRQESKDTIHELLNERKEGAKVIVTGCMVSKHRHEVESAFPEVHYFLGSGDVEGILAAVESESQGKKIGTARSYLEAGEIPRVLSTPKHFAYLKIAEGCRKACAYCAIPQIKGPLRSKTVEQILKEFRALLSHGVKEIILIAQDLGDYGKDKGVPAGDLENLLKRLLEVEGDHWIRLLYLYPDEITESLINLMKENPRICPYLDMPIQHINDQLLKSMKRHTNGEQIKKTITYLRQALPDIHIRTSLIVGFPGETDEQFEELAAFIQEYPLNHVGIFKYSKEEGTPAARLADQVPEEIKEARFQRLAALQQKVVSKLNKKMQGRRLEVVVEGYHPETPLLMVGRYFGQCPEIDGHVILNDTRAVQAFGERYIVEITGEMGVDLVGRVLPAATKKKARQSKELFSISK